MPKSEACKLGYLRLVFENANYANIGDATGLRASSTTGNLYIALFTAVADGEAGSVTEANYTGYHRIAVARDDINWGTGLLHGVEEVGYAKNDGDLLFPVSSGVPNTITHFGIYTALSGGYLIGTGAFGSILIEDGDIPQFTVSSLLIKED